jgi:hypothetical protein
MLPSYVIVIHRNHIFSLLISPSDIYNNSNPDKKHAFSNLNNKSVIDK